MQNNGLVSTTIREAPIEDAHEQWLPTLLVRIFYRINKIMQNKLTSIFLLPTMSHTHTHVGIAALTCEDERLTMSSTKVLLRSQNLINHNMRWFGNLTLMPASFYLYLLFLYSFLLLQWVSMREICTYKNHSITRPT